MARSRKMSQSLPIKVSVSVLSRSRTSTTRLHPCQQECMDCIISVSALLLSLERLNVKHLIMLRKINLYKCLLYSSDVFIHNMFCTFLCNNCDNGILFKPVFYRKSDAIHSVWSVFQDYVLC